MDIRKTRMWITRNLQYQNTVQRRHHVSVSQRQWDLTKKILNPWVTIILDSYSGIKKFTAFFKTGLFSPLFTTNHSKSLLWTTSNQYAHSHTVSCRTTWIPYTRDRLVSSCPVFLTKNLYTFLITRKLQHHTCSLIDSYFLICWKIMFALKDTTLHLGKTCFSSVYLLRAENLYKADRS